MWVGMMARIGMMSIDQRPVVFLGDPHLSDRQISTRVDVTPDTCLEKFRWVLDYANSRGADILCTGDVFSHTLYGSRFRYEVKVALRNFADRGGAFYSCGGNHSGDVDGVDVGSTIYRELGQFCYDGYINYLGKLGGVSRCYSLATGGVVVGLSAYASLDSISFPPGDVVGMVCHHWIMDAFGDSLVVYPDDFKSLFPNLRFIVAGHDHAYHEPFVSRDGVLVVRPGSMMRTDSGASSNRIPKVAVWVPDYDREGWWSYVDIGCARRYEEVFYVERRAVDAESTDAISRFVGQMKQNMDVVLDVNGVVQSQFELVPGGDKQLIRDDLVANGFVV
jgi:hypothetical protein